MSFCGLITWVKKLIITIILEVLCVYSLVVFLPLQAIAIPVYMLIVFRDHPPLPQPCNPAHLPYVYF